MVGNKLKHSARLMVAIIVARILLFFLELEQLIKKITVITQNVDDLHHKAGSSYIVEASGSID